MRSYAGSPTMPPESSREILPTPPKQQERPVLISFEIGTYILEFLPPLLPHKQRLLPAPQLNGSSATPSCAQEVPVQDPSFCASISLCSPRRVLGCLAAPHASCKRDSRDGAPPTPAGPPGTVLPVRTLTANSRHVLDGPELSA